MGKNCDGTFSTESTYNSREALVGDERLRTVVAWLASKPAGFTPGF